MDATNEALILISPTDKRLSMVSTKVDTTQIQSEPVQQLVDHMFAMAEGKTKTGVGERQMVGLAAVQVGVLQRIILIDTTADGSQKVQHIEAFFNPVLHSLSPLQLDGREGCWSCGNICGKVTRSEKVTMTALGRDGAPVRHVLTGFVARIAQHEIDHLDGIRFPERISLNQSERLHWVEPSDFARYRHEWSTWPILCPRTRWDKMKAGNA